MDIKEALARIATLEGYLKLCGELAYMCSRDSERGEFRNGEITISAPKYEMNNTEWVSVEARLPEPGTDVLVRGHDRHGAIMHTIAGLFHGEWASLETQEFTTFTVTHWMPIPRFEDEP